MKGKRMITNEPVIVIRYLKDISTYSATSQIEVRCKEGYDKTKSPPVIRLEILAIRKIVTGHDFIVRREYLVWCT